MTRFRRESHLRRRAGRRAPRPVILIVCEGQTEQRYFNALRVKHRVSSVQVDVADNTEGPSPISVVRLARQRWRESKLFDRIYCVFDQDQHASFKEARETIRQVRAGTRPVPLEEAISVPCVELWFLLHWHYSEAPHENCAAVERVLRAHMPAYQKNDPASCEILVSRADTALANARRLDEASRRDGFANPYTSAYRVAEKIQEIGALQMQASPPA